MVGGSGTMRCLDSISSFLPRKIKDIVAYENVYLSSLAKVKASI